MIVFGENVSSIVTSVRLRASMFSPVNAVIASGVSCRFSSRKRAVTTISSRPELCARATSPVKMAALAPKPSAAQSARTRRCFSLLDMMNPLSVGCRFYPASCYGAAYD